LRRNEKQHHVPETEADTWIALQNVRRQMESEQNEEKLGQLRLQNQILRGNLKQRTVSMMSINDYVVKMNSLLEYPGLRHEFKGENFEVMVKGRCVEVFPKLGAPSLFGCDS